MKLESSEGAVDVQPGERFRIGSAVFEFTGEVTGRTYSPHGLGGTSCVRCKLVEGTPDARVTPDSTGMVDLCGDSIALFIHETRQRAQEDQK